ncbi:hypothetical protein [Maricaulis sp.]|uniref:hypothetical protein n=1 Tax=Maricaulis sp. TaxID=1486257 RepID=UPI0026227C92|nr:hypothetical protein [Maricaulis sp.]
MKMVKLLTGAAAIALLAGAAQAQEYSSVDGTAGTDFVKDDILANEWDGDLAGNVIIGFSSGGDDLFSTVGGGEVVSFDVTLTNARFSTSVAAGVWNTNVGAGGECEFGNVARGGGSGQSFIGWDSQEANLNACDNADFDADVGDLTLPIERIDPSLPVSIEMSFAPVGSANFTENTVNEDLVTLKDAYTPSVTAGTEADNLLSIDGSATAGGFTGDLGNLTLGFDGTGPIRTDAFAAIAAGNGVDSVEVVIQFDDITGVASVTVDNACVLDDVANTATCDVDVADVDDGDVDVTWTHNGTDIVAEQTPTATIDVTSATDYDVAGLAATALAPITYDDGLESITLQDRNGDTAEFAWVNLRASGGTSNAFRVTGIESDLATVTGECVMVHVGATSAALPGDSEACIGGATVSASEDGTWTATFQSADLAAALGITTEAINGDVTFSVKIDDSIGAGAPQVERLLSRNGIVTGTGFDLNQ